MKGMAMKVVHKNQAVFHENASTCHVFEYPMHDEDINGAVVHVKGRYPLQGLAVNEHCKEMVYVIQGTGKVVVDDQETPLSCGDVLIIAAGERYYWEGDLMLFVPCTPAWYPEQHKYILDDVAVHL
jgi:mannose-6-phosphate isomerase-like protein (cupin superfamily)